MLHNFRTASRTAEDRAAALTALNTDIINLMNEGGVDRIAGDMEFRGKMAALIRESIADEFALTDPTPIFCNQRSASLGDKVEITKKHHNLRVVRYAPQSQPLIFSPVKSKYTVTTSMYELPWGIELFKIMTRQYEVSDLTTMAAQAMVRFNLQLVLTAINTACGVGAVDQRGRALRTVAGAADVTKTELDLALRRMGPGATIFGSRYALSPIFDFAGAQSENLKDELNARGVIGVYKGCKLVAVEDDYNEYAGSWTTIGSDPWEKLLFIASTEKGAVKIDRDLSALNFTKVDEEKAIVRSSERLDTGIFVDKPHRYHVIRTV
jgi:hypothetical protein